MSRYSSSSYEPLSPPWSDGGSSSYDTQPRAPSMPYVALPSFDAGYTPPSPHNGLRTPPHSSESDINPLLCANPTLVRYDFTNHPQSIRMSSRVNLATFPTMHSALNPIKRTMDIEIEGTDHVVRVRNDSATGVRNADVFEQLYAYLAQPLVGAERSSVHRNVKHAFHQRREMTGDNNMRVVDLLEGRTIFKRLVWRGGRWVLQTTTA